MTNNNQPGQAPPTAQQPAVLPGGPAQQPVAPPAPAAAVGGVVVGAADGPAGPRDALEFAWKVHGYTNEYIRFADGKAGVVMAWCAAIIGALFTAGMHKHFLVWPSWDWAWKETVLGGLSALAYLLLVAGVLSGVGVIYPRLRPAPLDRKSWKEWLIGCWGVIKGWDCWHTKLWSWLFPPALPPGLIFWDQLVSNGNQAGYWASLSHKSAAELARSVADHDFVLGQIASEKFRCIKRSIQFAVWGSAAAVAVFVLVGCWKSAS